MLVAKRPISPVLIASMLDASVLVPNELVSSVLATNRTVRPLDLLVFIALWLGSASRSVAGLSSPTHSSIAGAM